MSALFTPDEIEALAAPHVSRAWFAALGLPSGDWFLHSGVGSVFAAGVEWRGVSDPIGGRLVSIAGVEEPSFGQAAAVTIVLTGCDRDFLESVWRDRRIVEGRPANIYWCAFDGETQQPVTALRALFPRGVISAPTIQWSGLARRSVSITIENIWAAQNFVSGRKWNPADQRRLYAADAGMDFVGVKISENWL